MSDEDKGTGGSKDDKASGQNKENTNLLDRINATDAKNKELLSEKKIIAEKLETQGKEFENLVKMVGIDLSKGSLAEQLEAKAKAKNEEDNSKLSEIQLLTKTVESLEGKLNSVVTENTKTKEEKLELLLDGEIKSALGDAKINDKGKTLLAPVLRGKLQKDNTGEHYFLKADGTRQGIREGVAEYASGFDEFVDSKRISGGGFGGPKGFGGNNNSTNNLDLSDPKVAQPALAAMLRENMANSN